MVGDKRNVQRVARAGEGAVLVFLGFKVCSEEEQTLFATSFYHIEKSAKAGQLSTGLGSILFYLFLFFLYSRFFM
ncbi:hypothetical protein RVB1_44540 (plasmid) [Escherichia coli]|jgi:hypothetical protein|nr:hypothetical protein [Yersinia enterocolitica]OJR19775.1 hypothetical protein BK377_14315 [Escherichia coli]BCL05802.1 hypothetical protein RVB1_44540 [Escherichia coli]